MQVHRNIKELPPFRKAVITIGTFDGIHQGHRLITEALIREAKAIGGESVLITFHPHPRKIVQPNTSLQLINTMEEKIEILQQYAIDHLVIVPFTSEFAAMSAENYIQDFLVRCFHPHTIIIGYDHHFGKGRKGNIHLLETQSSRWGYRLIQIPKHVLNEIAVSSTKIREAIQQSRIAVANRLLGYPFFFSGRVVPGDRIGRALGFPTANLEYTDPDKIHLGHGVYAVYVQIGPEERKGMLSIGNRPTLDKPEEKVEVNIFDWEKEIYGQVLRVRVKEFLRPQEKYGSLEELKAQLYKDKEDSLRLLNF